MTVNVSADLNPQQLMFKEAYCNPNSATFSNGYQSAKVAGYGEEYCKNITGQGSDWLSGLIRDKEMLEESEKALKEAINYSVLDDEGKRDAAFAALKLKAAMFGAERLGKDKYSTLIRNDLTSLGEKLDGSVFNIVKPE